MLFNSAPFGQIKSSITINIYNETVGSESILPPPGAQLLLDNNGLFLMDNSGDLLVTAW